MNFASIIDKSGLDDNQKRSAAPVVSRLVRYALDDDGPSKLGSQELIGLTVQNKICEACLQIARSKSVKRKHSFFCGGRKYTPPDAVHRFEVATIQELRKLLKQQEDQRAAQLAQLATDAPAANALAAAHAPPLSAHADGGAGQGGHWTSAPPGAAACEQPSSVAATPSSHTAPSMAGPPAMGAAACFGAARAPLTGARAAGVHAGGAGQGGHWTSAPPGAAACEQPSSVAPPTASHSVLPMAGAAAVTAAAGGGALAELAGAAPECSLDGVPDTCSGATAVEDTVARRSAKVLAALRARQAAYQSWTGSRGLPSGQHAEWYVNVLKQADPTDACVLQPQPHALQRLRTCPSTGRLLMPDLLAFAASRFEWRHFDAASPRNLQLLRAAGLGGVPCAHCDGDADGKHRTVSCGTCLRPDDGMPKNLCAPVVVLRGDGFHHPFTYGLSRCLVCECTFSHIDPGCLLKMPMYLVGPLDLEGACSEGRFYLSKSFVDSCTRGLTTGLGFDNITQLMDDVSARQTTLLLEEYGTAVQVWLKGLRELAEDAIWDALPDAMRAVRAEARAELLAVKEFGDLSLGLAGASAIFELNVARLLGARGLSTETLSLRLQKALLAAMPDCIQQIMRAHHDAPKLLKLDFTMSLATKVGASVILSAMNAYGRLLGARAGARASLYEFEDFLKQLAKSMGVPLAIFLDNRPPQLEGARDPPLVEWLKRITGALYVLQDLWHVLHHLFATCDSRLPELAHAKRLIVDLVYERDAETVALIDDKLRKGEIQKQCVHKGTKVCVELGKPTDATTIDTWKQNGTYLALFGRNIPQKFRSRAHICEQWAAVEAQLLGLVTAGGTATGEYITYNSTGGKFCPDFLEFQKRLANARGRLEHVVPPDGCQEPFYIMSKDVDHNGLRIAYQLAGSASNETWHGHALDMVAGYHMSAAVGSALILRGSAEQSRRVGIDRGLDQALPHLGLTQLERLNGAFGHGPCAAAEKLLPEPPTAAQRHDASHMPPFLVDDAESKLGVGKGKRVSFLPNATRADLPQAQPLRLGGPLPPSQAPPTGAAPAQSRLLSAPSAPQPTQRPQRRVTEMLHSAPTVTQTAAAGGTAAASASVAGSSNATRAAAPREPPQHTSKNNPYPCTCMTRAQMAARDGGKSGNPHHLYECDRKRYMRGELPYVVRPNYVARMLDAAHKSGRLDEVATYKAAQSTDGKRKRPSDANDDDPPLRRTHFTWEQQRRTQ